MQYNYEHGGYQKSKVSDHENKFRNSYFETSQYMYAMAGDEWAGATEEQRPNRLQSLIIVRATGRVQTRIE